MFFSNLQQIYQGQHILLSNIVQLLSKIKLHLCVPKYTRVTDIFMSVFYFSQPFFNDLNDLKKCYQYKTFLADKICLKLPLTNVFNIRLRLSFALSVFVFFTT